MKIKGKVATIEPVIRKSHSNSNGEHPVKVRVTFNRNAKFYPIRIEDRPLYLSEREWSQLWEKQVRKNRKDIKNTIEDHISMARRACEKITQNDRVFSFGRFENEYILKTSSKGFIAYYEEYLSELIDQERVGTHHSYISPLHAFKAFRKNKEIDPLDITPQLLTEFEKYLKEEKPIRTATGKVSIRSCGKTTVGIYMRSMRVVYNYMCERQPYLKENYPFARRSNDRSKYRIKSGSGSKGDALNVDQLMTFLNASVMMSSPEWRAKQLWLFSFYCQGMNMNDVFRLKYSDIKSDSIQYVRGKTKDTERIEQIMEVPLNDQIREIILELGSKNKGYPQNYVFELLQPGQSPMDQRKSIGQGIKVMNKWLKKLASENDLPQITSYWSRHTYASLLKSNDVPVEVIRELLGHSDIKTTENYLKRFDLQKKRDANDKILAVMKKSA